MQIKNGATNTDKYENKMLKKKKEIKWIVVRGRERERGKKKVLTIN